MPPNAPHLIACRNCDLLHEEPLLPVGRVARCVRCGTILAKGDAHRPELMLALALAGILFFLPANLLPVMTVNLFGETRETSLVSGAFSLWDGGFPLVAALVLLVGVVLPLLKLASLLYVTIPLVFGWRAPFARSVLRLHEHFTEWGMLEVYLLGLIISLVKMRELVEIHTGAGLVCFAASVLMLIGLVAVTDGESLWRRMETSRPLAG